MKKILFLVPLLFVISIINVNAEGVSIKSINLVDSSGNATEISKPIISGLDIGFDLAFSNVGDTAKYEVVLNNPTNSEYEINTDTKFSSSNYISYTYELKDKSNRIKANSEVVLYITIKYENVVPNTSLVDGKYIENNNMGISLLTEDNPNTFNNILWILLIMIILIGISIVFKYSKNNELLIIVISLLIVPITVFALEKLKLTVNTKIMISDSYDIYYKIFYVKVNELNDIDYKYSNCTNNVRVVLEDGSYEEYYSCSELYKKDIRKHFPGERISMNGYNLIDVGLYNCTKDNDIYTCPGGMFVEKNNSAIEYGCVDMGMIDESSCSEDDLSVMNFSKIDENYWNDFKQIIFYGENEFTMPKHDVYFKTYYDK